MTTKRKPKQWRVISTDRTGKDEVLQEFETEKDAGDFAVLMSRFCYGEKPSIRRLPSPKPTRSKGKKS